MKPTLRLLALAVLAVLPSLGCERKTGPSPEFKRAHEAFTKLYAQKLDDAYLDPRIGSIEDDLGKVPRSSVDSAEATALLARINENRARMQKAIEDREAASEHALQPVDNVVASRPLYEAPDASLETPDAGPGQPRGGMSRADFEKNFLGCFEAGDTIDIQGRGLHESYRLKDITNCRERHPGFERLLVLMDGPKVLGTVPRSALFTAYADGGAAAPATAPDAGPPAAAPGAGTP